jgi:cell division protein FtsB
MSRHSKYCYHPIEKKETEVFALDLFVNKYLWVILVVIAIFIGGWAVLQYRVDQLEDQISKRDQTIDKLIENDVQRKLDIQSLQDQHRQQYIK